MANGTYTTDYCYLSAGTPAYFYSSSLQLGNSGDTIDLAWSDGAVDTLIDEVIYTAASTGRGVAYGLNPDKMDADANDDEANWCAQTTVIGTTADYGTPGAANDPCPTGVGDTGG